MTDLAVDLTLHMVDRVGWLREEMKRAAEQLAEDHPVRQMLEQALVLSSFGEMKVWRPGEEPF